MLAQSGTSLDLGRLLREVENASPVASAEVVASVLAETFDASDVSFLIADFSGGSLVRLGSGGEGTAHHGGRSGDLVAIAGTPHGRALDEQAVVLEPAGDDTRLFAPVTNRGEAIGVLELRLPATPDAATISAIALAAHALAYVVVANHRFTDLFEWGKRSVPISLAAEIQHRLLPGSYACEAGQFTLAAWLEPAGEAGGDTFDFALARDTLHLSMTDAMGHLVDAAMLATVLVGALRNARRGGIGLEAQARRANDALNEYARDGGFVTGQIVRVDLATETARVVNAGHPAPLRLRDGRVEAMELAVDPPFGVVDGHPYAEQAFDLEAGDRILFVTDGVYEHDAASLDLPALMLETASLHPRQAVQRLIQSVLETTAGTALADDATLMCLDWHGGPSRDRVTESGANV